jgi:hypothetical protein
VHIEPSVAYAYEQLAKSKLFTLLVRDSKVAKAVVDANNANQGSKISIFALDYLAKIESK